MFARCAVVLLGLSAVATARPSRQVERVFQAGVDAFRLGKLDVARTHLEKATKLDPKLPGPHRFLAAVAKAQARWEDCIDAARTALVLNPRSRELADTRTLHEACRAGAGRAARPAELGESAAIAVTTTVPGATVTIDGLSYGATPLAPRPITAGIRAVEIAKVGWTPARVTIDAPPGIVSDLEVVLEPAAAARETTRGGPTGAATTGALVIEGGGRVTIDGAPATPEGDRFVLAPGTHVVEVHRPAHDPWRRRVRIGAGQRTRVVPVPIETSARERKRTVGFVLVGTAAALAVGGIALRTQDAELVSNLTFAAAAASAGTGALLFYLGRRHGGGDPPPFAVIPIDGGAVLARGHRF